MYIYLVVITLFLTSCGGVHSDIATGEYSSLHKYDVSEINEVDKYGRTALGIAIANNDLLAVEKLIASQASLLTKSENEYPVFLSLSKNIDDEIFYTLYEKTKDDTLLNSRGYTLLHQAILKKEYKIAKYLMMQNFNLDKSNANRYQRNILHLAVIAHDPEVVQIILEKYPELQYEYDVQNKIPLEYALNEKYDEISKLLIDNFKKKWRDKEKNTILHLAGKYLNINMFNYIANNNIVDNEIKNKDGNTAEEVSYIAIETIKKKKEAKAIVEEKLARLNEAARQEAYENDPFRELKDLFTFDNIMKAAVITSSIHMANQSNMSMDDKINFSTAITKDVLNDTGGTNLQNFQESVLAKQKAKEAKNSSAVPCKKEDYPGYLEDKPQVVGNCKIAWLNSCNKQRYPSKALELEKRVKITCGLLDGLITKDECPVCSSYIGELKIPVRNTYPSRSAPTKSKATPLKNNKARECNPDVPRCTINSCFDDSGCKAIGI